MAAVCGANRRAMRTAKEIATIVLDQLDPAYAAGPRLGIAAKRLIQNPFVDALFLDLEKAVAAATPKPAKKGAKHG